MSTTNFDRHDLALRGDSVREQFSDLIKNIDPTEFVLLSNCTEMSKATNTYRSWQIQGLGPRDPNNSMVDGAAFGADSSQNTDRIGTYHQIMHKAIEVSNRAEVVDKAGRKSEMAHQLILAGKRLKRDQEIIFSSSQAARAGSSTESMLTAGLGAWLKTNTSRGATGTDPALSDTTFGTPTTAPGDGTLRGLTQTLISTVELEIRKSGGHVNMMMVGDNTKVTISNFMLNQENPSARIAAPTQDHGHNPKSGLSVVGVVDHFLSNFNLIDIVPNIEMTDRNVYLLDTDCLKVSYLRNFQKQEIETDSDSKKKVILVDTGFAVEDEKACGVIADINPATAMVA